MSNNAIEIKGLKKTYKGGFEALKGIDLTIKKGDIFALLGPNGAGKTSTIGVLVSLVIKTAGKVSICDYDLDTHSVIARTKIGIVPQEINLNMFETVEDTILQQAGFYGIPRREAVKRTTRLLKQLGLYEKRNEITRNLSGGMKRRAMIARGMVHEPEVLLLDEPTAGVDVEIRQEMWDFLREYNAAGTTILLTTHYLEEAENICKNIAFIDQGKIVKQGSMHDILDSLEKEVIVFELAEPIARAPVLADYPCVLQGNAVLEIEMAHEEPLNDLFAQLLQAGITIKSVKQKSNRLEKIFMDLLAK